MSARKFSVGVGIVLLICAVVGIFVVIFGTETNPVSSNSSRRIEESLTVVRDWEPKVRPTETTKRQRVPEPTQHHHHKDKSKVSTESERILWSDQRKKDSVGSREEKIRVTSTTSPSSSPSSSTSSTSTEKPRQPNERYGMAVERPKILNIPPPSDSSFVHQQQQQQKENEQESMPGEEDGQTLVDKKMSSQMSWNEFTPSPPWSPTWHPTPSPPPSATMTRDQSKVNLRTPLNRRILSTGEPLRPHYPPPSNMLYSKSASMADNSRRRRPPPHLNHQHHGSPHPSKQGHTLQGGGVYGFDGEPDQESQEEQVSEEDQYVLHGGGGGGGGESAEEEEDGQLLPGIDVGQLFDLASNLYTSGTNSSDIQGFLRVINETVNRGNNSGLLSRLNDLYSRPDSLVLSPANSNGLVGRNAYETSLTAFVFMSFGVFLLNQIHNFIGKEAGVGGQQSHQERGGRNFHDVHSLHDQGDVESNLEILFKPPQPGQNWTTQFGSSSSGSGSSKDGGRAKGQSNGSWGFSQNSTSSSSSRATSSSKNSLIQPGYVNDMFRALLNLVNAYTKDSQVLECIWSLYCQDLDQTAGKQGLYGIAARINSIGLRLIMDQIPAELTLDMMLRSLIGYDALPCSKMFPKKCQVDKATGALTPKS